MTDCRPQIIRTYAAWTALSALRSGAPIKSREDVYPLLATVPFDEVLDGPTPLSPRAFDDWHSAATHALCQSESRLCVGWAVKLLNVYLKTAGYIGNLGRPGLLDVLHPPIDGGLWSGLRHRFANDRKILARTNAVERIKDIRDYPTYAGIIDGCREAAALLGCRLIEVEQFWEGVSVITPARSRSQS